MSFERRDGAWHDQYWARDARGKWRLVLASPDDPRLAVPPRRGEGSFAEPRPGLYTTPPALPFGRVLAEGRNSFRLEQDDGPRHFLKSIELRDDHISVSLVMRTDKPGAPFEYFLASHAFAPGGKPASDAGMPDRTFAPALRPHPDEVIGDHVFRAPAVAAQKGTVAAALVPRLDTLGANRIMPMILDLDARSGVVDATLLSFGFCDHHVNGHVYFVHHPGETRFTAPEMRLDYDLMLTAQAEPPGRGAGFLEGVARRQWDTAGRQWLARVLPQTMPFAEYARACYPAALAEKVGRTQRGWWETEMNGARAGGVFAGWGYHEGNTHWQAWFNNLRSAYGMHWWGEQLGNDDWLTRSQAMLRAALAAPQSPEGPFPSTYNHDRGEWIGSLMAQSVGRGAYYDSVDMAWKGYWLLRWQQDIAATTETLDYCRRLGDFFVAHQEKSGAIPNWFTRDLKPVDVLREAAPTAMPGWFLAELHGVTGDSRYLEAARRAADFVAREVVPQNRYYDFEVFFSCSSKPCIDGGRGHEAMRDPHTLQPPQNTLCMQWTAELMKRVYELTDERRYLDSGLDALATLSMYQNAWPVAWRRKANTFGGFGVQNTDGEYNDARQSQFGCTLCDYGAMLGRRDLFERGVAAIRASLALVNHPAQVGNDVYPYPNYPPGLSPENTGHGGGDSVETRTGFDWGEGSGLAGAAYVMRRYGGVYADARNGWAVGIDGVTAQLAGGDLRVTNGLAELKAPFDGDPQVTPSVAHARRGAVTVNGKTWKTGTPISPVRAEARPRELPLNPSWDFAEGSLQGWQVIGSFRAVPSKPTRVPFHGRRWMIATAEDGDRGYNDLWTGEVYSPEFITDATTLTLLVSGGDQPGARVELMDATTHKPLFTERGRNREELEERSWNVTELRGKHLYIRVTDHETDGWGHINVTEIRCR